MPFKDDFVWAAAAAAYQIEGAASEGGRKPSVWDDYCDRPDAVKQGHRALWRVTTTTASKKTSRSWVRLVSVPIACHWPGPGFFPTALVPSTRKGSRSTTD